MLVGSGGKEIKRTKTSGPDRYFSGVDNGDGSYTSYGQIDNPWKWEGWGISGTKRAQPTTPWEQRNWNTYNDPLNGHSHKSFDPQNVTSAAELNKPIRPYVSYGWSDDQNRAVVGSYLTALSFTVPVSRIIGGIGKLAGIGARGGLNLFKFGSSQATRSVGWKIGDRFLRLADKGTPKLNWANNYGALRAEMKFGNPIFDSYKLASGELIKTGGFLNAERYILQTRGWTYTPQIGAWIPPIR